MPQQWAHQIREGVFAIERDAANSGTVMQDATAKVWSYDTGAEGAGVVAALKTYDGMLLVRGSKVPFDPAATYAQVKSLVVDASKAMITFADGSALAGTFLN